MDAKVKTRRYVSYRFGSMVTLAVIVVWSVAVLWYHLTEPVDFDHLEITILVTITVISLALVPIIWLQIGWGFLSLMLLYAAILAGGVYALFQNSTFFSPTIYNLSVLTVYATAIAGIFLSLNAYRRIRHKRPGIAIAGVGGTLVVAVAVAVLVQSRVEAIDRFRAIQIQNRVVRQLDKLETLDEKLHFLVEQGDIPALSAGIVVEDELVWTGAFGDAAGNSAYHTGSVAKMFTATAVMQLQERKLVELDGDVNEYLPIEVRHPDYPDVPISVRMLLTHQSGLNSLTIRQEIYFKDEAYVNWLAQAYDWPVEPASPRPTRAAYLDGLLTPGGRYHFEGVWSKHRPGTVHQYSNLNYHLLALLVESVSGQPFADYMQANVFEPLQMNDSGYAVEPIADRLTVGYERQFALLSKTNVAVPDYANEPGPGSLISTVSDLSQFLIAQLNHGQVDGVQLLNPASIGLMHERAVDGGGHINKAGYGMGITHLSPTPWEFYGHYYGLGGAMGHEGGDIGYSAAVYCVEEQQGGYGFVLLTNVSSIGKDMDYSWYFPVYYKIHVLLMEEAVARYEDGTN